MADDDGMPVVDHFEDDEALEVDEAIDESADGTDEDAADVAATEEKS